MTKHTIDCVCIKCLDGTEVVEELYLRRRQVDILRAALEQMDLQICAAGDLMTKEDQQEALRLEDLRDSVLKETE